MKKNILFVLGTAAILASCSNNEVVDQPQVDVPKSEVPVTLSAESNIAIEQTRAVVDKWADTPIYVWGLDKMVGANWSTATSNLFSPASYVQGVVTNTTGNNGTIKLGSENDVYFYPLSSDVNFSFYACSPFPNTNTLQANNVIVSYEITGNKDILWGEAVADDVADGNVTYSGYNARYFRKGGVKPVIDFKHKLTQLIFKGVKGKDENADAGDVTDVQIKNITVASNRWSTLTVAGAKKGTLVASNAEIAEIPAFFGDDNYLQHGSVTLTEDGVKAGTTMLLPSEAGTYDVYITLDAVINGVPKTLPAQKVPITFKDKDTNATLPFEEGKAYNVNLAIYGLRAVSLGATLTDWVYGGTIDQEVN